MTPIEIFANLFNLASVFFAYRSRVHTWWTGIIGTILLGILFFEVKLYADVILQVFFILTGLWGWWNWLYGGKEKSELPITRVQLLQLFLFAMLATILTLGHGFLLHSLTDASFPFIDSIILVCSIIAQFLLIKRKLESWYFWILVDLVAVPLYAAKELYLTSAIYFVFLILAISGLWRWRKIWLQKKYRNGLIVGKFSPLHKGHEFLIRRGLAECETLYIFSYYTPEFTGCESHQREYWLNQLFPSARVFVINDEFVQTRYNFSLPPNEATDLEERRFVGFLWLKLVDQPLDAVFTSENYGDGYAAEMSKYFAEYTDFPPVKHVLVDLERNLTPISGTELRSDIHGLKDFLSPLVYASFVERICFLGGESSGKSVLTKALAKEYKTTFAAEYGRTLSEEKNNELIFEDLLRIAKTHIADEEFEASQASRYLFIDTSPLTTLFYSLHLFGKADPELFWLAKRKYDRIFLCAPDFPFFQDGTREGNGLRERQHEWYLRELQERKIEFEILEGNLIDRINTVKAILAKS